MKVRLYYEQRGAWSIDYGTAKTSTQHEYVIIDKIGITHTDPTADNITEPRAWLEFIEGRIDVQGTTARIY